MGHFFAKGWGTGHRVLRQIKWAQSGAARLVGGAFSQEAEQRVIGWPAIPASEPYRAVKFYC